MAISTEIPRFSISLLVKALRIESRTASSPSTTLLARSMCSNPLTEICRTADRSGVSQCTPLTRKEKVLWATQTCLSTSRISMTTLLSFPKPYIQEMSQKMAPLVSTITIVIFTYRRVGLLCDRTSN